MSIKNAEDSIGFSLLQEVENYLSEVFSSENILGNTRLLKNISNKETILRIINSLLIDRVKMMEISNQSYTHANGFDKILLINSTKYRLRLHIWWPDATTPAEDIHNHAWDFSSYVITGDLRFQTFKVNSNIGDLNLHHYRTYPHEKGESGHIIDYLGTKNLELMLDAHLKDNSFYTLSKKIFHKVINTKNILTATLVLTGPAGTSISDIFKENKYVGDKKQQIEFFDFKTLTEKLEDFQKLLI